MKVNTTLTFRTELKLKGDCLRAVRYTAGRMRNGRSHPQVEERLEIHFYPNITTGSWYGANGDFMLMNNLMNNGHGPGQAVIWSHKWSAKLAARWFMEQKEKQSAEITERKDAERRQDRADRYAREQARSADLKRRGIVLIGGIGQINNGLLFKLPAA